MALTAVPRPAKLEAVALTKATVRAAHRLGLKNRVLAAVIGVSEATVSRMSKSEFMLAPDSKSFELSAMFVRLFRALDAKAWLVNINSALGDTPINLIQSVSGLVNVVQYLDTRRARI